ncbi:trypsin-like peptidase domain-containing protein [uncultured Corynebacterium sp.]|uniref:trypsin-like peptidase domain-containing protein n=1 Tax=uncultured Corynebacterium sp. TaxID=159447 RepID=UPI0025F795B9|nr:trypsin-like peptidase domain-containing protein [uncultured Corynebacterium sp.]
MTTHNPGENDFGNAKRDQKKGPADNRSPQGMSSPMGWRQDQAESHTSQFGAMGGQPVGAASQAEGPGAGQQGGLQAGAAQPQLNDYGAGARSMGQPGQPGQLGRPSQSAPMGQPGQPGQSAPMGQPGRLGQSSPMGQPGQQGQAGPTMTGQPGQFGHPGQAGQFAQPGQLGQPVPPAPRQPKRWSTTSLVAMVLAGSLVAGAATAVVGSELNGNGLGNSTVTSFDQGKPTSDTKNTNGRPPAEGSVEEVASKVLPSVVSIQVQTADSGADGSGSIISNDGLIVTNNHVVSGAENGRAKIAVQLHDGRVLPADLVASDPTTDVAVIKARGANDLQPIKFGDSNKLNVGQEVVAIGSPLGLSSTVTRGIVSAKNRPVQAGGEKGGEASLIDAIQTDAAINPGNSGGALVNMNGELVGIPSVIASLGGGEGQQSGSIGLGFAIPVNQAQDIAKQLVEKKKVDHPAIGAQVNTSRSASSQGAEIVKVESGSPADKAGLKSGDVVLKVDDRLVEGGVGLIAAIRSHRVGDKVTLTVLRDGKGSEKQVEVTLGSR